jgi:sphingomyelin phosphodiesterase
LAVPIGFGGKNTFLQNEYNWDWNHISRVSEAFGWLGAEEVEFASSHYGGEIMRMGVWRFFGSVMMRLISFVGYALTTERGLRIISINTDFWYNDNYFIYFNTSNPDISGTLRWLADELQACEDNHQRAWILGESNSFESKFLS